jgi:p-aminobenzoyl-glutamate transporter AbgT
VLNSDRTVNDVASGLGSLGIIVVKAVYALARIPLLTMLVLLKPLVTLTLAGLGLLLILTALFFEAVSVHPVPFLAMLFSGFACVAALALYHGAIRLLS